MRKSKWVLLSAALVAAVAGFVLIIGCEKEPSTDMTGMGDYHSESRDGEVPRTLVLSPEAGTISHVGQEILFSVKNGDPAFSWHTENSATGVMIPESNTRQAVYHAYKALPNTIFVTDAASRSGAAGITAGSTTVKITPSSVTITGVTNASFDGAANQVNFIVTGLNTTTPTWDTSQHSLGTISSGSSSATYTPVKDGVGVNTIYASDTDGNVGVATVTQQ